MVLEKTLESPLDSKEIQPVHPKGDQSWGFTGRTDAEAEASLLWPPDVKSYSLQKALMLGKPGEAATEDEMVGWYHQLNGHESEQAPGDGERQGSLTCCSPWGHKKLDTT